MSMNEYKLYTRLCCVIDDTVNIAREARNQRRTMWEVMHNSLSKLSATILNF